MISWMPVGHFTIFKCRLVSRACLALFLLLFQVSCLFTRARAHGSESADFYAGSWINEQQQRTSLLWIRQQQITALLFGSLVYTHATLKSAPGWIWQCPVVGTSLSCRSIFSQYQFLSDLIHWQRQKRATFGPFGSARSGNTLGGLLVSSPKSWYNLECYSLLKQQH